MNKFKELFESMGYKLIVQDFGLADNLKTLYKEITKDTKWEDGADNWHSLSKGLEIYDKKSLSQIESLLKELEVTYKVSKI